MSAATAQPADAEVRLVRGACRLPARAATVWAHLADAHRLAALNPDSLGVEAVDPPGGFQPGQRWTERARSPMGVQHLYTHVEEVDAAAGRLRLRAEGPLGARIETLLHVRDDAGGSTVTLEHRLLLPRGPLCVLTAALVSARIEEGTEAAMRHLRQAAEGWVAAEAPAHPPA